MLEDLEPTKFIEEFLLQVTSGMSLIEDIWIERDVTHPGTSDSPSSIAAQSLSKKPISNLTELLEDDLNYSFKQRFLTFRFVAATPGSGKTTLLQYLEKRIEFRSDYYKNSLLFRFDFPQNLLTNNQNVRNTLYSAIIAKTFSKILANQEIKSIGESFLREFLGNEISLEYSMISEINLLKAINAFLGTSGIEAEDIFFHAINQILKVKSNYTFVYLIDELDDALRESSIYNQQIRSVFKSLINKVHQNYNNKIPIMIYLAGKSDIIQKFINEDSAFERRVRDSVINLFTGRKDEFRQIKDKINKRIKDAYRGKENFDEACREIDNIKVNYSDILGNFCKDYASKVLGICQKYFIGVSENSFDGTISELRELVESECKRQWKNYLGKYELKVDINFLKSKNFSFSCYATLEDNKNIIARAYGGARNYSILKAYLDNFINKLEAEITDFEQNTFNEKPPDIAFVIAPECSIFIQKILDSKKNAWVDSSTKQSISKIVNAEENLTDGLPLNKESFGERLNGIDINLDDKNVLTTGFKGTGIGGKILDEIIDKRPYKDLRELKAKVKGIASKREQKIQEKLATSQLCFKIGVFLCHNSQDKSQIITIANKLKEQKISVWLDTWDLVAGDDWQRVLERQIEDGNLRSAAIFIGKEGLGPWQTVEMDALLRRCVNRGNRVIPVVLKGYEGELKLPTFLSGKHYVDFRKGNPKPLEALIQAIKS